MGFRIICWEPIGTNRRCGRAIGVVERAEPAAGKPGWYAINASGARAVFLGDDLDELRGEEIAIPVIGCPAEHHTYLTQLTRGGDQRVAMRVDRPMLLAGDDLADRRRNGIRATTDDRGSPLRPATATDPLPDPYRWPQVAWPSGVASGLLLTLGTAHRPVMSSDGTIRAVPPKRDAPKPTAG